MNRVTLQDAFLPQGSSVRGATLPAATIEAGAMWIDAYNEVTTVGHRYVQGEGCTTVGVAGLIQSGGFGSFSKRYGAAAAGLQQAEVVTADGQVRIANSYMNSDLFWASKGGGGGAFLLGRLERKAGMLPSGDQRGEPSPFSPAENKVMGPSPSACLIQIRVPSSLSGRFPVNFGTSAALPPSGESEHR